MPEKFAIYCHFCTLRAPGPPADFQTQHTPGTWVQKTKKLKNLKNVQNPLKMVSSNIVRIKIADLGIFSSPGENWPFSRKSGL